MFVAKVFVILSFCILQLHQNVDSQGFPPDYGSALSKSLLFFEAQRSGRLPYNQRVQWRGDSALADGKADGVDLVGGYYVSGDNVKYGLPMAFAVTMLSWSVVEFGDHLEAVNELSHALDAIKWGTDYLIKAHPFPEILYGQVGDGITDHGCWQRPEDMTTPRNAYNVNSMSPGADLAGETAAALASASLAFQVVDRTYSSKLLSHSIQLFQFADKHHVPYYASIPTAEPFYRSTYCEDELMWAARWLYQATKDEKYLQYIDQSLVHGGNSHSFSWDDKFPGVHVFAAVKIMKGKCTGYPNFPMYKTYAEQFICNTIGMGYNNYNRTNAGLLWIENPNNLQYVTSASFILLYYAEALLSTQSTLHCYHGTVEAEDIIKFVYRQVHYILGANPMNMSYMVGYGQNYPQMVRHKGASIMSIKKNRSPVECKAGFSLWEAKKSPNPNVIEGAVVGGPAYDDSFKDSRDNSDQNEPSILIVAPLVGVLAYLA